MALKRKDGDPVASTKKSKRVGFATVDPGVEANECIKVFLVSRADEIGAQGCIPINPVDIGHFFGEDGKIYGYKDLKIDIWVSCISFHAYSDIKFQGSSDGGKGITELEPALQKIFGESLVEKEEFLRMFASETHYIRNAISSGVVVQSDAHGGANGHAANAHEDAKGPMIEVVRMDINSMEIGLLYSRLVPLILLLVEGSRPIDITDPRWEIYFIVKKVQSQSGHVPFVLLGFSTVYLFYHYPDSIRLRIGQILVLPPYQRQGHGRCLLESINSVAMSENLYDVTAEEPSEYLQHLRACIDTSRLLAFEPVRPALDAVVSNLKEGNFLRKKKRLQFYPSSDIIEAARKKLKINKKQFLRCWDVLIFLDLDQGNPKLMEGFKACISDSLRYDILDKNAVSSGKHLVELPNEFGQGMTFALFQSKGSSSQQASLCSESDKATQEQQLNQLVEERMDETAEVAQKVLRYARKANHPRK